VKERGVAAAFWVTDFITEEFPVYTCERCGRRRLAADAQRTIDLGTDRSMRSSVLRWPTFHAAHRGLRSRDDGRMR
jgi:hypothetical protein